MTQDTAVTMMLELDILPNKLIPEEACPVIAKALERMWAVGYEEGRASKNTDRPVAQCDTKGGVLQVHPSITIAARRNNVRRESISMASQPNNREMKYKVELLEDNIYQIVCPDDFFRTIYFQGTLPECQAWIWLKQNDNI